MPLNAPSWLEEWDPVSDGHRTSAIKRPRSVTKAAPRGTDGTVDGTRFGDLTRPIAHDRRLVKAPGYRLLIGVVAIVVVGALMAALFVLPVKSWFRQRDDLAERQRELAVLTAANAELAAEVNYLQTPDGIKEAAREEIGFGELGEKRITVMPAPDAPITLPVGWPYDGVTQIVAVRVSQAAAEVATTVAPTTVAPDPAATTVVPAAVDPNVPTTLDPSVTVPPTAIPEAVPDAAP
jgi:cell division protein FtsB